MPALKFAGSLLVGAVASASISLPAFAVTPTLSINDGAPLPIHSPSAYVSSGSTGKLSITTDGYAFCANIDVGQGISLGTVTLTPNHEGWTMPTVGDIRNVGYSGGTFRVNRGAAGFVSPSTLACQVRDADGRIGSPVNGYGDFIFSSGFEDVFAADVQMSYLVNWTPDPGLGFHWSVPDWTEVPNDSCTLGINPNTATKDVPRLAENTLCAAATGVRPVADGSQNDAHYGDRAPTMWTQATSANFVYLARIDTRFGATQGDPNSHFLADAGAGPTSSAGNVDIAIRDAYDTAYLGSAGSFCLLNKLPVDAKGSPLGLDDQVCDASHDKAVYATGAFDADGLVQYRVTLVPGLQARSLYVAVVRQKLDTGAIGSCQPAVGIAAISDPDVGMNDAGDQFIGDNVVFGFRGSDSFDWMGCQ